MRRILVDQARRKGESSQNLPLPILHRTFGNLSLMINGRNDDLFELQRNQIPLFEELGSEIKKHLLKPSFGHGVPADEVQKKMDPWLERVFADDSARIPSTQDERTAESA
jgi:hypothetical protein